jgi:hypothetical protein
MRLFHSYKVIGLLLLIIVGTAIYFYRVGQINDAEFLLKVFSADNYIRSKLHIIEVKVQKTEVTKEWPYQIKTEIYVIS